MSDTADSPNLTKVREWEEPDHRGPCFDNCGCDEWPRPPAYTEYRVEGQMRLDILARVGRTADDPADVRLIEGVIEGGYSEYTVEHDYPIEVWIREGTQSQRVFDGQADWSNNALPALLRWLDGDA